MWISFSLRAIDKYLYIIAKVKPQEPENKEEAKPADDKAKKPETKGRSKKAKVVAVSTLANTIIISYRRPRHL
jgi:hypothetical protein